MAVVNFIHFKSGAFFISPPGKCPVEDEILTKEIVKSYGVIETNKYNCHTKSGFDIETTKALKKLLLIAK